MSWPRWFRIVSIAIAVLPVVRSPMISSRWPRPIGIIESIAFSPGCNGSLTGWRRRCSLPPPRPDEGGFLSWRCLPAPPSLGLPRGRGGGEGGPRGSPLAKEGGTAGSPLRRRGLVGEPPVPPLPLGVASRQLL